MVELEQPRFICQVTTRVITSLEEAERLKTLGNACFKSASYQNAADFYQQALGVAPSDSVNRAIYHGNKAACHMHLAEYRAAVEGCTEALSINATYTRVRMRRSQAYEHLQDYQSALNDAQHVLDLEPGHVSAKNAVERLQSHVESQKAAVKEEMMGKLKDLGNTVLGTFGVSLDDFKAEKDPESGNYHVSFKK